MSYPGSSAKGQDPREGEERAATADSSKTEVRKKICSLGMISMIYFFGEYR